MPTTDTNQHPMWTVYPDDDGIMHASKSSGRTERVLEVRWLRAPTASAALARAEAMRAGKSEPIKAEVCGSGGGGCFPGVADPQPAMEQRVAELEKRVAALEQKNKPCIVSPVSSAVCYRGTKGCSEIHMEGV